MDRFIRFKKITLSTFVKKTVVTGVARVNYSPGFLINRTFGSFKANNYYFVPLQ